MTLNLNVGFRGADANVVTPPLVSEPLPAGTQQQFNVLNFATNEIDTIQATLGYVSEHAYFWFDTTDAAFRYEMSTLTEAGSTFDDIYDVITFYFGRDAQPGVDGDPRVYILHVTPQNLCSNSSCGVLGYFNSADVVPPSIDPSSNGHELFIINESIFGNGGYYSTLAHEFRHLVEDNHDQGDWDWEVEGSATLAQYLWGDQSSPVSRANVYLANPDRNLFTWPDGNSTVAYGHGFLFNRFLFWQMGQDSYRAFALDDEHGFAPLDQYGSLFGLTDFGVQLWQNFLVGTAIHDRPNIPIDYDLGVDGLLPIDFQSLSTANGVDTTVHQFGSDYYRLDGEGSVTLEFNGNPLVPLLPTAAPSGAGYWISERGNQGDARLTRTFDLTGVSSATLEYDVFYDLEEGYDFAYVSVSTDGVIWQPLVAPGMQSRAFYDPGEMAFAEQFYTGISAGWVREWIDLTPFAGQIIQIRFQVVTDPILTHPGLALDNITVAEIGFYDYGEGNVTDWIAQGFIAATSFAPQLWSVQLVTFPDEVPTVTPLLVSEDGTGRWQIDLPQDGSPPLLIVAGMTPQTMMTAEYTIDVIP